MIAAAKYFQTLQEMPTNLSSAELRQLLAGVERKSVFAARMNILDAVEGLKAEVTNQLLGTQNLSTGVQNLQLKLDQLGYTPEEGFPGVHDRSIPPAEADTLRDLSSDQRVKLMLQTNFRQALNFTKQQEGNTPEALNQFPAWELVRIYARTIERGERLGPKGAIIEVPDDAWEARFQKAAEISGDDDALRVLDETGRMIARKDSPLWDELGNPDNFDDAIGTNYPPFAFNSGMGWRQVSRAECVEVGLIDEGDQVAPTEGDLLAGIKDDADNMTLADLTATRADLLKAIAKLEEAA